MELEFDDGFFKRKDFQGTFLLYTSDAADELLCVDLGGRLIIKKKKKELNMNIHTPQYWSCDIKRTILYILPIWLRRRL